MSWIDIRTENDVKRMLERVEHFHDWFVASYSYDALGNCDDNDLNLGRLKEGLDASIITFRWDCKCKGQWPEVQLRFGDVSAFDISLEWLQEGCPLYEANLEETAHGWVLINDCWLTPEEREHPLEIKANLFVLSGNVKWRPVTVVTPDGPDWWTSKKGEQDDPQRG